LLAFATPATAGPGATAAGTERFAGVNRYDTAAKIALDDAWTTCNGCDIVVANGENYPDGLAAAALGQRVLLVTANSIPAETAAAIKALEQGTANKLGNINVVGGTAAISSAVFEALAVLNGGTAPVRWAGADRYATALKVAGAVTTTPGDVILATGANYPDALAAGPLAMELNAPIVLNDGPSLRAAVKTYLAAATGTVYIVGGTAAVPESVEDQLEGMGKIVKRLAGANRSETAVAVAAQIVKSSVGTNGDHSVVLVNGNGFADALAAGPFAGQANVLGTLMLTNASSIPAATAGWHVANCNTIGAGPANAEVYAAGGVAVISDAVLNGAAAATKCTTPAFTASVSNSDYKQRVLLIDGADGVTLTARANTDASGAAGNDITVVINESTGGASANLVGATLTVEMVIPAKCATCDYGLTQAQFAAAWNAIGGAAALFVAAPTTNNGAPHGIDPGDQLKVTQKSPGSQDQTITVTFNQDVDDTQANTAGAVLDSTDFAVSAGTFVVVSPLVSTPGGASTYTLVADNVNSSAALVKAGVGTVVASGYSTSNSLAIPATPVVLTAG
jgi:putative cell wall-binding protein